MRIKHGERDVKVDPGGLKERPKGQAEPKTEICPMLVGLNRMGCRWEHCQWWVVDEELAPEGICAIVALARGALAGVPPGMGRDEDDEEDDEEKDGWLSRRGEPGSNKPRAYGPDAENE